MSQIITISSLTANTPYDIYYCDSMSANCVYVTSATTYPVSFSVPTSASTNDFIIKIIDSQGCQVSEFVYITPTPTNYSTNTPTPTISQTPTLTPTITNTITVTPSNTITSTVTPSNTVSPTSSPIIVSNYVGKNVFNSETEVCKDVLSQTIYYTYLSEAFTSPQLWAKIYLANINGVLYNPLIGYNKYYLMSWISGLYVVQINNNGEIIGYNNC